MPTTVTGPRRPPINTYLSRLLAGLLALLPATVWACPTFDYARLPTTAAEWADLLPKLRALQPACLRSSEYFALLGAAQLNSGHTASSVESLERALLLNPDNRAAQIDYAEALYQQGALFPAIELNQRLLNTPDLPPNLAALFAQRDRHWRAATHHRVRSAGLMAGYDSNLNGASNVDTVTLTLPDRTLILALADEATARTGGYIKQHAAQRDVWLTPGGATHRTLAVNARQSGHSAPNYLEFEAAYGVERYRHQRGWQLDGRANHMLFGGESLYTTLATEAEYRWQQPLYPPLNAGIEYQKFHQQPVVDGIELSAGTALQLAIDAQPLDVSLSVFHNHALDSARPGGNRQGIVLRAATAWAVAHGTLRLQAELDHTQDKSSYSTLLENGARRTIKRRALLLQYHRPLARNTTLTASLYRHQQSSNLTLFENSDTNIELGLIYRF